MFHGCLIKLNGFKKKKPSWLFKKNILHIIKKFNVQFMQKLL